MAPPSAARINVARWVGRSAVNGPGERFVLWTQGCNLGCEGCWNRDTWSFAPKKLMTPNEIMALISSVDGIEGVTLTGGEPFQQTAPLVPLARMVRSAGLSLMIFTGYDLDELLDELARELLAATDIVVAGRYLEAERDLTALWRGSRNQQLHFLSRRYGQEALAEANCAEIHIREGGVTAATGFPDSDLLNVLAGATGRGGGHEP